MANNIHYDDIKLAEKVDNILSADFWMQECITSETVASVIDVPLKFSASVSVFVKRGSGVAEIGLIKYQFKSPCIVNIHNSQILQLKKISDDFEGSFIVLSRQFTDNLFLMLKDCRAYSIACREQIADIPEDLVKSFEDNVKRMYEIYSDTSNPYAYQAQIFYLSSFFYKTAIKCFKENSDSMSRSSTRFADMFINMVQHNFRKERFLEFYAKELGVSTKHLSRTLKEVTGFTAVEWIERYVVLEAKVLLKSTNMSVQQIADELNFNSHSFFGKYFKKIVGMTPRKFRYS